MLISKYGNGSEELVHDFEDKHGLELDEEYRKFLIKYNGGDTPNTCVGKLVDSKTLTEEEKEYWRNYELNGIL